MRLIFFVLSLFALAATAVETVPCAGLSGLSSPAAQKLHRLKLPISSAVASPDGNLLYLGTQDGAVVTLNSQTLERVNSLRVGEGPISLAFQGEGLIAAVGKQLFEVTKKGSAAQAKGEFPSKATKLAATKDLIAVALEKGRVELRNTAGKVLHAFNYPQYWLLRWLPRDKHYVSGLALTPDGTRVAAAIDTGKKVQVCTWETATGKMLYCVGANQLNSAQGRRSGADGASPRCNSIQFTSDGKTLVTAWAAFHTDKNNWVEKAFLFDGETGKPQGDLGHSHGAAETPWPGEVVSVAASNDSSFLALGRSGSKGVGYSIAYRWLIHGFLPRVDIFHPRTAEKVATLIGHKDPVAFVLFAPNGTDFFSISETGEVVRWGLADLVAGNGKRFFFDDGTFLSTEWKPYAGVYDGYQVQDR